MRRSFVQNQNYLWIAEKANEAITIESIGGVVANAGLRIAKRSSFNIEQLLGIKVPKNHILNIYRLCVAKSTSWNNQLWVPCLVSGSNEHFQQDNNIFQLFLIRFDYSSYDRIVAIEYSIQPVIEIR